MRHEFQKECKKPIFRRSPERSFYFEILTKERKHTQNLIAILYQAKGFCVS